MSCWIRYLLQIMFTIVTIFYFFILFSKLVFIFVFVRKRLWSLLSSLPWTPKSRDLSSFHYRRDRMRNSLRPWLGMSFDAEVLRWRRMWKALHFTAQCDNVHATEDVSRVAGGQWEGRQGIRTTMCSWWNVPVQTMFEEWTRLLVSIFRLCQNFEA